MVFLDFDITISVNCHTNDNCAGYSLNKFLQSGIDCEADIKKADWSRRPDSHREPDKTGACPKEHSGTWGSHSLVPDILSEVEGFCYFFLLRKKVE